MTLLASNSCSFLLPYALVPQMRNIGLHAKPQTMRRKLVSSILAGRLKYVIGSGVLILNTKSAITSCIKKMTLRSGRLSNRVPLAQKPPILFSGCAEAHSLSSYLLSCPNRSGAVPCSFLRSQYLGFSQVRQLKLGRLAYAARGNIAEEQAPRIGGKMDQIRWKASGCIHFCALAPRNSISGTMTEKWLPWANFTFINPSYCLRPVPLKPKCW